MNDMLGRHSAGRGNDSLSGRQPFGKFLLSDFFTLFQYLWTACSMNCAIDAATTHQSAIGGIDDRVYLFFGDVADLHRNSSVEKSLQNFHQYPATTSS
jgi:hypothetical protein